MTINITTPGSVDGSLLEAEMATAGFTAEVYVDLDGTLRIVGVDEDDRAGVEAVASAHAPAAGHVPLDPAGVTATLNAVLGVWPLADAAKAVHLPEQTLVDEAMAWAEAAAGGA